MRTIKKVIIHCSDSDIDSHDDISVIRDWHVNENGWSDVGYHYFIQKNGNVQIGRNEKTIGAHCRGYNRESIGICLHGKYKEEFTNDQFTALAILVEDILRRYNLDIDDIYGHKAFDKKKSCPNFSVARWVKDYLN